VLQLILEYHNTALAGHLGRAKTFNELDRQYWKDMRRQVDQYVPNCHSCQRSRSSRHATFGVPQPLPVCEKPWEDISIDLEVGLPECQGLDAIWVVVDRLSKMRHFIPSHTTIDAIEMAKLCLPDIIQLHGFPFTIVSHQGAQFASTFRGQICSRLGMDLQMSTVFHPHTDGQMERMNPSMEHPLRVFIDHQQDDWVQWLALAEFGANIGISATTMCTTFLRLKERILGCLLQDNQQMNQITNA